MSDIKIIKVATGGASKVDSSGFFIKSKQPSQSEPSQLSQFIQKENEREGKKQGYEEDEESVDSMTVSDVSSATNSSDEEYTNESMTPAPLPAPSSPPPQRVSSIVRDETLNSYLEKPKVESQPSSESLNINSSVSTTVPTPSSPAQTNNAISTATATVNEPQNNNAQSTTAQPANNRNDYYSDTEEDVIDMTDNKLYDILASVLEDEDGENVSENMSKMNRNLEKVITMFEAYQQNNAKDEYLSKIGEAIENQNKILSQIVRVLEKQGQLNQEANISVLNANNSNEENNNKKHNKHEKPKSSSESSSESDKGENTEDTQNIPDPNIKKVKISESLKHSTSTSKKEPLKHRIQIKRKT